MKIKYLILFILVLVNLKESLQMRGTIIRSNILVDGDTVKETEDNELDKYLKTFLINLKDNKISSNKLKEKGVSSNLLKNLIEKYLKMEKIKGEIKLKSAVKNINDYSSMIRFKASPNKTKDAPEEILHNVTTTKNKTNIITKNLTSNITNNITNNTTYEEKKTIYYSQIIDIENSEKIIEDCGKEWDYTKNGDDWTCICNNGNFQSPLNLEKEKSTPILMNSKIFFDLRLSEPTQNEEENSKLPLIKNIGTAIEINFDCGIVILPSHMNGYKCYSIQIHTPSEHKIESKSADMEIQFLFKLKDKQIMDQTTRDYLVLVILVNGVEEENYNKYIKETVIDHPFIELFEINNLPINKGLARLLTRNIDLNLLFDKSKQPFKLLSSQNENKIDFFQNKISVLKAIEDFAYDKNYPLREYYLYNGSFTNPPCNENVTYIVLPNAILTKMQQIIDISKVIISSSTGNKNGNNRSIQKKSSSTVYYYKNQSQLIKIIDELNLTTEEFNSLKNNSNQDFDSILNNKNTKLKEILDIKKLR